MDFLDQQMKQWSIRLRDDLGIDLPSSESIATTINREVAGLSIEAIARIKATSKIPIEKRLDELIAFQYWMDLTHNVEIHPAVTRAKVIVQNYICFVYLGDSCFKILKAVLPIDSATAKCCKFLIEDPIRAFRNAIAHAHWQYLPDFSGLEFWDRRQGSLTRFEVSQQELAFWQALARCTAYASFLAL